MTIDFQYIECFILFATVTLEDSFDHSEKADICLAMGSSLTVTPAANIPEVQTHFLCPFSVLLLLLETIHIVRLV